MKRVFSLLLVMILATSLTVPAAASYGSLSNFTGKNNYYPNQFKDVPSTSWCHDNVEQVYKLGLMLGNTATTFNPTGYVTEAQALVIAARIHKIYTTGNDDFSEIKQEMANLEPQILEWCGYDTNNSGYKEFYGAWYSPYVYYLCYHTGDEYAYPIYPMLGAVPDEAPFIDGKKPLSRERFAYYMAHALPEREFQQINIVENDTIPDMTYEQSPEVYQLYRSGVIIGSDSVGTFNPSSNVTRGAVAAIITRIVNPSLRQSITLTKGKTEEENKENSQITQSTLSVSSNNLNIKEATSISVNFLSDSSDTLTYEVSNELIVSCTWGEWEGASISLNIVPLQNGTTTIRIFVTDNPEIYQTITVTVTGHDMNTSSDIVLQRMAALGIDYAYQSAKYPSTLHLNHVTYSDKFQNGYGDLITRMVLRCYAGNAAGGYGDLYVVVLCCDHEATGINDYYWDGLYFSLRCYAKNPGTESHYMDNATAMNAYTSYMANPHTIPYD